MRQISVIDLETLGMAPPAAVIEYGEIRVAVPEDNAPPWVRISTTRTRTFGIPEGQTMPPDNRAVHHIDPATLTGIALFSEDYYLSNLDDGVDPVVAFCAHNAEFEAQWVTPPPGIPWICTYKVALRAWPDAPSHSNQALKYLLGIRDCPDHHPPHRALPDTRVTAELLLRLLRIYSIEEMVAITLEPRLLPKCPIGKFRGLPWAEVEQGFLSWMLRQPDMEADLRWNAERELTRRRRDDPPQPAPVSDKGASLLNDQDMR